MPSTTTFAATGGLAARMFPGLSQGTVTVVSVSANGATASFTYRINGGNDETVTYIGSGLTVINGDISGTVFQISYLITPTSPHSATIA